MFLIWKCRVGSTWIDLHATRNLSSSRINMFTFKLFLRSFSFPFWNPTLRLLLRSLSFPFETSLSDFYYDPFPFLLKPYFQTSFTILFLSFWNPTFRLLLRSFSFLKSFFFQTSFTILFFSSFPVETLLSVFFFTILFLSLWNPTFRLRLRYFSFPFETLLPVFFYDHFPFLLKP